MRSTVPSDTPAAEATSTAPSGPACPACRSSSTTTTAKHPDAASYWRCRQCGEVWNVERRQHETRSRPRWW